MNRHALSTKLRSLLAITATLVLVMVVPTPAFAQTTWYVDDNAVNDPGPGDPTVGDPGENGSLDHPFDAIQEAIDVSTNGDVVLLADGTYTGVGNRDISYQGKAITVRSESGNPSACIIDCEGEDTGFSFSDQETVDSVLDGVTVTNGYSSFVAGGISFGYECYPIIRNCIITNNEADWSGGGLRSGYYSHPTISNCIITQNTSGGHGGAIDIYNSSSAIITNCLVAENRASEKGGGISCSGLSSLTITNCTIVNNNAASGYGEAMYCALDSNATVTNCIVWDHSSRVLSGGFAVTYSDIEGGYSGTGNIDADPLFVQTGDYHLSEESPCIDGGTNSPPGELADEDLDGEARIADGDGDGSIVVDMGAYEYLSGDCNGNGIPDEQDIADGTSDDCNDNGIPDECEPECNDNSRPDECDIADGTSEDCNSNGIPDECDIASGDSPDFNSNGVPDECEVPSNGWIIVEDTTIDAGNTTYDDCPLFIDGCTLLIESTRTFESLILINGAVVSAPSGSERIKLTISGDVAIDSTSSIQAPLVKGTAGSGSESQSFTPPEPGFVCGYLLETGSGGGHGGIGGDSADGVAAGGGTHGNYLAPSSVGGRGGSASTCNCGSSWPPWDGCNDGGFGGGAIQLNVGGVLRVDGSVSADGGIGSYCYVMCSTIEWQADTDVYGGCGAGGSVYLTVNSLCGSGQITANGGVGSSSQAEGGGGRIAVYYDREMLLPATHIAAIGYENGTIHIASTTDGDFDDDGDVDLDDFLVFHDCFAGPDMTPIPAIAPGADECLYSFDFDDDGDVDLIDFTSFQTKLP